MGLVNLGREVGQCGCAENISPILSKINKAKAWPNYLKQILNQTNTKEAPTMLMCLTFNKILPACKSVRGAQMN